uniref:Large ribosomal subunit protein uL22c n=1 Tax=Lamprocapnos spectabilis TaxID=54415 RepID=A0A385LMC0_9MAGN|nr:ribosomal protein L22 [Lamprocapnos spectabilis]AYA29303.1 ribosomal protein L22 [Lamprocapnos spectabilis]
MNNKDRGVEIYALGKHIRMSIDKARRVIDHIRGLPYIDTLMILAMMPYRACSDIFKLVYSAAANASHNLGLNKIDLIIRKAEVNRGIIRKKLKLRARGHSYPIKRTTCYIIIVLEYRSKDQIRPKKDG